MLSPFVKAILSWCGASKSKETRSCDRNERCERNENTFTLKSHEIKRKTARDVSPRWKFLLVKAYSVAGSVCPRNMTHEFKPAEFHATCCGDKFLSPQQNFFAKTGMLHGKKKPFVFKFISISILAIQISDDSKYSQYSKYSLVSDHSWCTRKWSLTGTNNETSPTVSMN